MVFIPISRWNLFQFLFSSILIEFIAFFAIHSSFFYCRVFICSFVTNLNRFQNRFNALRSIRYIDNIITMASLLQNSLPLIVQVLIISGSSRKILIHLEKFLCHHPHRL
ncbi:hypothetical protein NH340_JMT07244 [Sarcoptes scabiei]|nr:hypothetical protein NH340_JMT07244 [Sarcoptes scabiei]